MTPKLRKSIALFLLATQFSTSLMAAVLPVKPPKLQNVQPPSLLDASDQALNNTANSLQSLNFSSNQLGISSPINAGVTYSNLTGAYFNGQFLQKINEKLGFNILGEYGDKQYRLNGTVGFLIAAQTFFKITAEQLGQKLPFYFSTGSIDKRVKQNAGGVRVQHFFNNRFLDSLSFGSYVAQSPNDRLAPIEFFSNGSNCNGFAPGYLCVTERNIAGANSAGGDLGLSSFLTPSTYLEGRLYYDTVRYNTIFSYRSDYDKSGVGGGVYAQQLILDTLKLSASAEARKIYNTYNVAVSWLPLLSRTSETEFSILAQRVVSHNQTPNNDMISVKVAFFMDKANYRTPIYSLNRTPIVDNIGSWLSEPAVKMNQVLAISEEYTHLAGTSLSALSPGFGPLTGGNVVTLSGTNFLPGSMVLFGNTMATITAITPTTITVVVPQGVQLGSVDVKVVSANGQVTSLNNGYLYTNGFTPIVTLLSPLVGPVGGGTLLTITGVNFVPNETSVSIDGITIPANLVTVNSPTSLTITTPAHPAGTVLVTVTTPAGTSSPAPGGFTYIGAPTITGLNPNAGATAGGTVVSLSGSSFVAGNTSVTINGNTIAPSLVTVLSPSTLTFTTPAHVAGNVAVTVATPGGTSAQATGGFTYNDAAPTVISLTPSSGPSSGGTNVTITGTQFITGATTVNIGGTTIPAANVNVTSTTTLEFLTPTHAAGNVALTVSTANGTTGFVPGGYTFLDAPAVISMLPVSGPTAGGTVVTVTGNNFVAGNTTVLLDGSPLPSTSVNVESSTSLKFTTPNHIEATVSIAITTPGGSVNVPGTFSFEDTPIASSLSPNFGTTSGGTTVTIQGDNFQTNATSVMIGSTTIPPASVTVISDNQLQINTPSHAPGPVAVMVSTPGGVSATVPGGFTYGSMPTLSSIIPAFGSINGGSLITLNGTNFISGNTSVTIGGTTIPANNVTVLSDTSLTFTLPPHAAGNVIVTVTTAGGTSVPLSGGFTYEDQPTATSLNVNFGSTSGGTQVIVTGTNFIPNDTTVTIGSIQIPKEAVNVTSSTSLTFTTPPHTAGNVSVVVSTSAGTSAPIPGGFTYVTGPTLSALDVVNGPVAGGTSVTITGSGFVAGDTTVLVDGIALPSSSVTVNSSTSVSFTTPAHGAGTVNVTVQTSGGLSGALPFTYLAAPTSGALSVSAGSVSGGTVVTVPGSNFVVGQTMVTIGTEVVPATVSPGGDSLTFTTPAQATAGNVSVTIKTPGGSVVVPGGFTYVSPPTIASLNPIAGPGLGGFAITVTGSEFVANETSIIIGGTVIPKESVTVSSSTSLTFTAPSHALGAVDVVVTTPGGQATLTQGFTYNNSVPTVLSIDEAFGSVNGNTTVTLTGSNFVAGSTTVNMGGQTVIPVTVTPTTLIFLTPSHAIGNVSVSVTTPGGTSGFVPGGFTYVDVPTVSALFPNSGPLTGGTLVTVTGTNFVVGDTLVVMGSSMLPVTVISDTSLTFVTPSDSAGVVNVSVMNSAGTSVPALFTYTNTAATVNSLSPASGPVSGGTQVTISGTNFVVGNTTVNIDGMTVAANVQSATSLTFITPVHAAGNVNVRVTTPAGNSGAVPNGFTYLDSASIASLSVLAGPVAGGTQVILTGTNFVAGDTSVTIDGVPAVGVNVNSSTSLTFTTPAHGAGLVGVSVTTSGGTSTLPNAFTYLEAPSISLLSPVFGPIGGNTTVTVTGTNFVLGNTTINLGGSPVAATVQSGTSLTFVTPAHVAGNVAVSVSTAGGVSLPVIGGFTYIAPPIANALSSVYGPIAGGILISITGNNFVSGDTSVTIGSVTIPKEAVTVNSATSLSFTLPAQAAGNVAVTVSNSAGTSAAVSGGFTYLAMPTASALSPAFGPIAGGTLVTVTGSNFVNGDTSVTVNGVLVPKASVNFISATAISFNTPSHAAGNVSVIVSTSGGSSAAIAGGFTYVNAPTSTALTPVAGPVAGGTLVTITGTNFVANNTQVNIGGAIIPVNAATVTSSTSLSFTTPARAAGNVSVTVITSGGSSNVAGGFTYTNPPTATAINPTSGTTAGGTPVTLTGTNFVSGGTSVTMGGTLIPAASVNVVSPTSLSFSTPNRAAGNVAVSVTTAGGQSANIPGGYTYLAPSLSSCTAPLPSLLGIQLLTCVGTNLTLFQTTFLRASGSAACSTFPTQTVVPTINLLGNVLVTATNIPSLLTQGLIGCNIQLCSNSTCSVLGGTAGPIVVTLGL